MWEMLINAALLVRNQVCKRRHSRSIDFVAILRRLYYVSSNIHDINHISNNFERFDVKNNGNFSSNGSMYVPCEHQNFIENSDHTNIFADLQGTKQGTLIPVTSLKHLSVLKWWFGFSLVFPFLFHQIALFWERLGAGKLMCSVWDRSKMIQPLITK